MASGTILSIVLHDSSPGWTVSELVIVDQGGNTTATVMVDSIDGDGVITSYHLNNGGSGYLVENDVPNFPEPEGPTCLLDILSVQSAIEVFVHAFH